MSLKTLHQYTAQVSLKDGGEPVSIDYDVLRSTVNGFFFCREDGSGRFLAARIVDEMTIAKNDVAPLGAA